MSAISPAVHLGVDLAWGPRNPSGVATVDAAGALLQALTVRTDDDLAALVPPGLRVVALDAPLVVVNPTGRRRCEAELTADFHRFHAGAYPSNLSRPWFSPEPRAMRLARRLGWWPDPTTAPPPGRAAAIEVYPHPATVSLFGLDRVLPYKARPTRSVADRALALTAFADHLERVAGDVLRPDACRDWARLRADLRAATRPVHLRRVEDPLDAVLCAHLAWLWDTHPERLRVYGDGTTGAIVTPPPPPASATPPGTSS